VRPWPILWYPSNLAVGFLDDLKEFGSVHDEGMFLKLLFCTDCFVVGLSDADAQQILSNSDFDSQLRMAESGDAGAKLHVAMC
jgi:hypothetical protein